MIGEIFTVAQLHELACNGSEAALFRSESARYWINLVTKDHPETLLAEIHDHEADIYLALEGEGDLYLGGALRQPTTLKPGQHRGAGLDGAEVRHIRQGDLVIIPEGTPHMVDARGYRLVYAVIKCALSASGEKG